MTLLIKSRAVVICGSLHHLDACFPAQCLFRQQIPKSTSSYTLLLSDTTQRHQCRKYLPCGLDGEQQHDERELLILQTMKTRTSRKSKKKQARTSLPQHRRDRLEDHHDVTLKMPGLRRKRSQECEAKSATFSTLPKSSVPHRSP